jgi:hypothetical protein
VVPAHCLNVLIQSFFRFHKQGSEKAVESLEMHLNWISYLQYH